MRKRYGLLWLLLVFSLPAMAQPLVIYSGRSKALVEPLVKRFEAQTGVRVKVRYGKDAQLLAVLQEEGARSPADLFWANTSGALSEAARRDLLARLPDDLLQLPARFVPQDGRWVPVTVRFRVLAYNPERVDPGTLPRSVLDLPGVESLKGRIGWTPAYSSFQDFVTAMRKLEGDPAARAWLEGMKALQPKAYPSNTPMLLALASGEIDVALTNHYYVYRLQRGGAEGEYEGPEEEEEEEENEASPAGRDLPLDMYHFAPGDVGNLALVTGAGVLQRSKNRDLALAFLRYLLSSDAQEYTAESVYEYPVVPGVRTPDFMLPVREALELSPEPDFGRLEDLNGTLNLLRELDLL
ncbi:iron ABC transporter substrate-binding protein [Oceanithermus sp.]|uniref:iron ABC transporter substrate-binding protein n=1 Tax=Oceanithermus sp. TaxID=2268145 RepID=UPI00257A0A4C|nr:iron ABC transporter substrate-binding protein [Oceanithermus sp.]